MKEMYKIVGLASGLLLLLLLSFVVYEQARVVFKSNASSIVLNRNDSFVFTVPACGTAGLDGQSVRTSVVALTTNGLGLENASCKIVAPFSSHLSVVSIQSITDSYGKAMFDVSAEQPGIYEVKILCNDEIINDRQKICFQ